MNIFQKILVSCVRFFVKIYLGWGIYRFWSSIHRFLYDRKWKNVELQTFTSIEQIARKMKSFKWKQDKFLELWDAICTPQKVQAVGFDGTSPHGNDCDEEAIWLTNVIKLSLNSFSKNEDLVDSKIYDAFFFTVTWYNPIKKKFGGHNVCLLDCVDGYRFMDYFMPHDPKIFVSDVARQVVDVYGGKDSIVLCYNVTDQKLKNVKRK